MMDVRGILRGNEIRFGYRIGYLSNVFSGPVYRVAEKKFGIQRPMFATLFCIAHEANLTATNVCNLVGISKNTISRAVAQLEKKQLLVRHTDPDDSRSAFLTITPAGRKVYESILPLFQAREKAMVSTLTREEQKQLLALIDKIIGRDDGWANSY